MIHFTADHAQQALWRANLLLLSSTSQKISSQSSWRRAKRSCRVGDRWRKWFRLGENCLLRSSLHQYINNQHPIAKNDNCLVRRHPRTPASCDTVVWIQPWIRKEKIGSKWVQTWMFGRDVCDDARQMRAHRSLWRIDRNRKPRIKTLWNPG